GGGGGLRAGGGRVGGVAGEWGRGVGEGELFAGGGQLDVGGGGGGEDFGLAHGAGGDGGGVFAAGEAEAVFAFAPAFDALAGLHGGLEAVEAALRAGAGEVFQRDVEGGIGAQAGLLDEGVGGALGVVLRDEVGVAGGGASQGFVEGEPGVGGG